jgi:hypothetical protein
MLIVYGGYFVIWNLKTFARDKSDLCQNNRDYFGWTKYFDLWLYN